MSLGLNGAHLLERLSSLPVEVHEAGSLVLAAGAATGKLLIMKEGAVEVVVEGTRVAEVSEPWYTPWLMASRSMAMDTALRASTLLNGGLALLIKR